MHVALVYLLPTHVNSRNVDVCVCELNFRAQSLLGQMLQRKALVCVSVESQEKHSSLVFSMEAVSYTWLCLCECVHAPVSVSFVNEQERCNNNLSVAWLSSRRSFLSAPSISFPFPARCTCT